MDIATLTHFFLWCTILNVGILILSLFVVAFGFGLDFVYRLHNEWFPMPRETFTAVLYSLIGVYKIFVLVFNLVPLIALIIIG